MFIFEQIIKTTMKNYIYISLISLLLISCNQNPKNIKKPTTYKINIKSDLALNDTFFLKQVVGSNFKIIDSLVVTNLNEFQFEGTLKNAGFYALFAKNTELNSFFALDSEPITLFLGNREMLYVKSYSGTSLNIFFTKVEELNSRFKTITDSLNQLYIMFSNTDLQSGKQIKDMYDIEFNIFNFNIKKLIRENPKSIVSVYATEFLDKENEISFLDSLAEEFILQQQTSDYILSFIDNTKKLSSNAIGSNAKNFTLDTPDGSKISLSDYKGKYTLIDFWASWCGPCRKENPALVKVYQKYKTKNFDILGVSLDDNLEKWKNAIETDKLEWKHVSDLKGWENQVAMMYNVESIPSSYLLDTEGKIIAKSIRSEELDMLLKKILKQ